MKRKPRRGADQMDQPHNRKRKIENSLDIRDDTSHLITASLKKQRAGSTSGKSIFLKHVSNDSRLFLYADDKEAPKMLQSITCPVFELLKSSEEESSSSCISSVEQDNSSDEKLEDTSKTDVPFSGGSCVAFSTCGEVVGKTSSVKPMTSGKTAPPLRLDEIAGCVSNSMDDDLFGSQAAFHVGEICTVWAFEDGNREGSACVEDGIFDSEGASLFLAIQHSKLGSINHSCSQTQPVVDEDLNDFDPYLFIKQLPDLSEVVSPCPSPALLPKQTQWCHSVTLVLDLDETLVHSSLDYCENVDFTFPVRFNEQEYTVFVRRRPHLQDFLERVSQMFEIVVFTASQSVYAEPLLNMLDPKGKIFQHRMFRDSCIFVDGNYVKDLSVLGVDLRKVMIIDNSPQAFSFQVDNGIPIESWFDDESDSALLGLLPFLETLVDVDDVRPSISRRFNLRQKMTARRDLWAVTNEGDPLDRC